MSTVDQSYLADYAEQSLQRCSVCFDAPPLWLTRVRRVYLRLPLPFYAGITCGTPLLLLLSLEHAFHIDLLKSPSGLTVQAASLLLLTSVVVTLAYSRFQVIVLRDTEDTPRKHLRRRREAAALHRCLVGRWAASIDSWAEGPDLPDIDTVHDFLRYVNVSVATRLERLPRLLESLRAAPHYRVDRSRREALEHLESTMVDVRRTTTHLTGPIGPDIRESAANFNSFLAVDDLDNRSWGFCVAPSSGERA